MVSKSQAYEKRNLSGFEGDRIIEARVKKLIDEFKINWVIETGCYLGGTTAKLSKMCEQVTTTEINEDYYRRAKSHLSKLSNVTMLFGDTVILLPELLRAIKNKNILFWLDDHWRENIPLLAELEIIAEFKLRPIICVHDFLVPGRPDLGFDQYGDIKFEWDWIAPSIEKIYGADGYVKEYNSVAEGAKRGIIYIWPR